MRETRQSLRARAESLRREGKTYAEIITTLRQPIPKSTLSHWCRAIALTQLQKTRISLQMAQNNERARSSALIANRKKQELYLRQIDQINRSIKIRSGSPEIAKIILAALYLGEGTKANRGAVRFGNSDPKIVHLFLNLLREVYDVDEARFRITVLCRADQNTNDLNSFWAKQTSVPLSQFYRARVDSRTVGKATKNKAYKGVCVIDYFSAYVYHDLMSLGRILCT